VLKGSKKCTHESFSEMREKYGDVFTFWLGNRACVFIFDLDIAKETFNKAIFSGRPDMKMSEKNIITCYHVS
jgi:hypothetical protein